MVELVDAGDSKSPGPCGHEGSIPSSGTIDNKGRKRYSPFFLVCILGLHFQICPHPVPTLGFLLSPGGPGKERRIIAVETGSTVSCGGARGQSGVSLLYPGQAKDAPGCPKGHDWSVCGFALFPHAVFVNLAVLRRYEGVVRKAARFAGILVVCYPFLYREYSIPAHQEYYHSILQEN